jgi:hypothetical protein
MYIEFLVTGVLNNQVSSKLRPSCGVFAGMCFYFFYDPCKANYRGLDSLPPHTFRISHTSLSLRRGGYDIYYKQKYDQEDTVKLKEIKLISFSC